MRKEEGEGKARVVESSVFFCSNVFIMEYVRIELPVFSFLVSPKAASLRRKFF